MISTPLSLAAIGLLLLAPSAEAALSMDKAERKIVQRARFEYPRKTQGRTVTADCNRVSRREADCTYVVGPNPFNCARYGYPYCRKLHGTGTVRKTESGYLLVRVTKPR